MSQAVKGTFATASVAASGNDSPPLVIPDGTTTMRLTLTELDASNTVKTQKRTAPGGAWADQTTYNSNQAAVAVTVAAREEWRVLGITQQAFKNIQYTLSAES